MILTLILAILDKSLELVKIAMDGQTPQQRAAFWQRHLDATEWMSVLLKKFSDRLERLIDTELIQPIPRGPILPIIPKGKV